MMAAEEFIDTTIAALKIIGMVPKSGKLCVRKGQLSLDVPTAGAVKIQGLRRWINGDSRDITLMHARNTINSAVKISKSMMSAQLQQQQQQHHGPHQDSAELARWTLIRLVVEMEQCDVGLRNLRTTYTTDSMMVANLDVLSDRLRAHKNEVSNFIIARHLDVDTPERAPPILTIMPAPATFFADVGGGVGVSGGGVGVSSSSGPIGTTIVVRTPPSAAAVPAAGRIDRLPSGVHAG